jgi:hypothetical protein
MQLSVFYKKNSIAPQSGRIFGAPTNADLKASPIEVGSITSFRF